MPLVYETLKSGDGPAEAAVVVVEIANADVAWSPDATLIGAKQYPVDAGTGRWEATLDANALIDPPDTAWKVSRYLSPDDVLEERPDTVTIYVVPAVAGPVMLSDEHALVAAEAVDINAVETHNEDASAHTGLAASVTTVADDLAQEITDRAAADAATLSSANTYTDDEIVALQAGASANADTLGELETLTAATDARVDVVEADLATETSDRQSSVSGLDGRITTLEGQGGAAHDHDGDYATPADVTTAADAAQAAAESTAATALAEHEVGDLADVDTAARADGRVPAWDVASGTHVYVDVAVLSGANVANVVTYDAVAETWNGDAIAGRPNVFRGAVNPADPVDGVATPANIGLEDVWQTRG